MRRWRCLPLGNHQGPPDRFFALAKRKGFDFYVITDHSQEEAFQPVDPLQNAAWVETQAAARRHSNPNFIAMAGIEFSRNPPFDTDGTGIGHLNALNIANYVNAQHTNLPEFYEWLKQAETAGGEGYVVASFNHPA
jgi:hypothetical protein